MTSKTISLIVWAILLVLATFPAWSAIDFRFLQHMAIKNAGHDQQKFELDGLTYVGEHEFKFVKRERRLPDFLKFIVDLGLFPAIAISTFVFGAWGGFARSVYRIIHVPNTAIRTHWLLPIIGALVGCMGTFVILLTELFLFDGGFPKPVPLLVAAVLIGMFYEQTLASLKSFLSQLTPHTNES